MVSQFFSKGNLLFKSITGGAFILASLCLWTTLTLAASQPYISSHGINFGTGNKYEQTTDISLPGPGAKLSFTRTYNSQSSANGILGYGWSGTFGESLQLDLANNRITLIQAGGRHVEFINDGSGTYINQTGKKRAITAITDGYQLTEANGNTATFDSLGRLSQKNTPNNLSTSYTYTGDLLSSVNNNFGKTLSFTYQNNKLHQIVAPNGTYTYSFDANDNLTSVQRPDTTTIQYIYDDPNDAHNLTGIIDENNTRIATIAYDTYDRVISSAKADGQESYQVEYLANLQRTITDSLGTVTTYQLQVQHGIVTVQSYTGPGCSSCGGDTGTDYLYNSRNQVSQSTDAKGNITSYTYDTNGNRLTKTEAVGTLEERTTTWTYDPVTNKPLTITKDSIANPGQQSVTTMTYDTGGNMLTRTESGFAGTTAISRTTTYTYDSYGRPLTIDGPRTDVNDLLTMTYYANDAGQGNNRGHLHTVTDALGRTTTYSAYNVFGKPGNITSPAGTTSMTYDADGRLLTSTSHGITTTYTYDITGLLTRAELSGGRFVTYDYDTNDRLTTITGSLGNSISYSYDSTGKRTREEVKDPAGTLTRFVDYQYEQTGQLDKTILADGATVDLNYDPVGNLVERIDALNNSTTYSYDALNRLTAMTEPGPTVTDYFLDADDNLSSLTDAKGNTTSFIHDDFGNRTRRTAPDTGTTNYSYDLAGNLITVTDAKTNTVTYGYDAVNRPTHMDIPGKTNARVFTYDSIDYLSSLTDESGTTGYTYNATGNVTSVSQTTGPTTLTTLYGYDAVTGELNSMTYPSGLVVGYQRDANGSITGLTANGQTLAQGATYMPFGPLKGYTYGGDQQTVAKGYNQRYNLTSIQGGGLNYQYTHDPAGQVKTISGIVQPGTTDTSDAYNYEPGSNRLDNQTGTTSRDYTLDANGNTTSDGTRTFHYDVFNRLIQVEEGSTTIAEYAYNSYNQRVSKTINGTVILYLYDLAGNLIAETAQDGTPLREYIYFNGQPFALMIHESTQAGLYFFINDHLGTPQRLVTSSGQPVWQAAYLPYGKAQIIINTITNNLRFPGQYWDAETGLHYNWNRYYDPDIGRYISADSIGLQGGINLFAYVQNNPVNGIDPLGLHRWPGPIDGTPVIPTGACHSGNRPNLYLNIEGGIVVTGGINHEVCCKGKDKMLITIKEVCYGVAGGVEASFTQDLTEVPQCSGKKVGDVSYGTETGGSYYAGAEFDTSFGESGGSASVSTSVSLGWFVKNTACRYEVISIEKIGCCD